MPDQSPDLSESPAMAWLLCESGACDSAVLERYKTNMLTHECLIGHARTELARMLAKAKAEGRAPRWRDAKTDPPGNCETVIAWDALDDGPFVAICVDGDWRDDATGEIVLRVTHWMPLPEPPADERKAGR